MINYQIKNADTAIMSFRGENLFLSNFYEGKVLMQLRDDLRKM